MIFVYICKYRSIETDSAIVNQLTEDIPKGFDILGKTLWGLRIYKDLFDGCIVGIIELFNTFNEATQYLL